LTTLSGRRLAVYAFLCAVWGSTWLVIKIGLRDLPPLRFAGFRMALACLVLAPAALSSRWKPSRSEVRLVALSGFLQIGLCYGFVFTASQWIASGLTAILFASFPIFVGLFAHFLLPEEPLTRRAVASAATGLLGVAVIEAPAVTGLLSPAGQRTVAGGALVLAAAIVSGYVNVLIKKALFRVPPLVNVWGQTLVGSAVLLLAAVVLERGAPARWTPSAFAALGYLAFFGTVLTFAGLFWLIPKVPVAVVGTIPLVDTLIAVLLGSLVLRERLSAHVLGGGMLILAGVVLSTKTGFRFRPSSFKKPTGMSPET
jgi:drug/metabolite transporter (DMT)-like permease